MSKQTNGLSRRELLQGTIALSLFGPLHGLASRSSWREAASLPLRVQEIYPCVHKGEIWVAGGLSPDLPDSKNGISDRVMRYKLDHDVWQEAAALPEPRHHGYLVSVDGELLLFGGFVAANGGRWSASRDILKLDGDQWNKIAEMPEAQMETVAAHIGGKIHFAGGRAPGAGSNADWNDQIDVATHQVFDPKTLEMTSAAPLPTARNSAASFVFQNQWHVVGGRTVGGGNSDQHDIYDFSDGKWRKGPPMPQAQGGLAAASVGNNGYVFGGEYFSPAGGGLYSQVWQFDGESETWRQAGTMPVPRHGLGAVSIGRDIFVVAGATAAGGRGTSNRMSFFSV